MLRAVCDGERKVSIRSGHGVGKSTAASWVMLWYLITRYPVKIVVTAPTSGAAIRRALRRSEALDQRAAARPKRNP